MHVAHSSTNRVGSPFASAVLELPLPVVVERSLLLPLLLAKLATCGVLEPPHAARALAAAATTRTASQGRPATRLTENSATGARP
jgi:hypothetical protein